MFSARNQKTATDQANCQMSHKTHDRPKKIGGRYDHPAKHQGCHADVWVR